MNELKIYGNYYKVFKSNYGIPEKVTVIKIDGDIVTIIRGHYTKEELQDPFTSLCECTMLCNKKSILMNISDKQKELMEIEEKKVNKMIERANKELIELKYGSRIKD